MNQPRKPMTAEQKEKLLKILKLSSMIFPALFLAVAFLILPNIIHDNEGILSWIQLGLVIASILDIIALRIVIKSIEKKPVVS